MFVFLKIYWKRDEVIKMVCVLNMDKQERKNCIKNIEKHLKNYNYYLKAIANIERQLSQFTTDDFPNYSLQNKIIGNTLPIEGIQDELSILKLIAENIEEALKELNEIEMKYVECRYFKKWTISKSALEIGYSDKALFAIRNQLMDKLLLVLGSIIYIK